MVGESLSLLTGCRRGTAGLVQAAGRLGDGAAAIDRLMRSVGPLIEGVRDDIRAMRTATERLERRIADVQQELVRLDLRVANIERTAMAIALDVSEATGVLGDSTKGPIARVRDAFSATTHD